MSSLVVLSLAVPVLVVLVVLAVWPWRWPVARARVVAPVAALTVSVVGVVWAGVTQASLGVGLFAVPGILAAVTLGLRLREHRRSRVGTVG